MNPEVDQHIAQSSGAQEQPSSPVEQFELYGRQAARDAMKALGLPAASAWFNQHAPANLNDLAEVQASGQPIPFWMGMHSELTSVGGTA